MKKIVFIKVTYQYFYGEDEKTGEKYFEQTDRFFLPEDYDRALAFFNQSLEEMKQHSEPDEGGVWGYTEYDGRELTGYYYDFAIGSIDSPCLPVSLKVIELDETNSGFIF